MTGRPFAIPGPAAGRSPESILGSQWLWIPGSRASARAPE
jgi:hypothetical protein